MDDLGEVVQILCACVPTADDDVGNAQALDQPSDVCHLGVKVKIGPDSKELHQNQSLILLALPL